MNAQRPKRPGPPQRQRRVPRVRVPLSLSELWARQLDRSGMWLGVLVVVVVAVVVLFEPVQIWFQQQVRLGELRAAVTNSKAAVASMQDDLERWGDRAYVEAQARQRLLFVYPGDVAYLIVNDIVVDESVAVDAAAAVRTTDINWVEALLASYIAAAVDQEPK